MMSTVDLNMPLMRPALYNLVEQDYLKIRFIMSTQFKISYTLRDKTKAPKIPTRPEY